MTSFFQSPKTKDEKFQLALIGLLVIFSMGIVRDLISYEAQIGITISISLIFILYFLVKRKMKDFKTILLSLLLIGYSFALIYAYQAHKAHEKVKEKEIYSKQKSILTAPVEANFPSNKLAPIRGRVFLSL